jgi:RNA polymerase sigma-70 factor, ECF subfamily
MLDEAGVSELYRRYGHALYRRCFTLVRNEADARELLQEVFCQFFKNRGRFLGQSSPFTYLYRIATNLSIDRLRRRTTAGDQRSFEETRGAGATEGPDKVAHAAEELLRLTEGLDEETLTVAVMSHVDGLTQDEIAAALDLSRRTIGKRLARFLAHTRDRAGLAPAKVAAGGDDG